MCSIAGILGTDTSKETCQKLLTTMTHRGPDGNGIYRSASCTLLHARLSVIDPDGGSQPMILDWNRERYVLVYNGELYNTTELRKALLSLGHQFRSHSDTEVLLHAYAEYGAECLEKLNGIYSFAVWEQNKQRLFLARDRIGVKPLFYRQKGNTFLFASEMKTILAFPGIKAQLDSEGAAQLILLGPGRLPGSGDRKSVV